MLFSLKHASSAHKPRYFLSEKFWLDLDVCLARLGRAEASLMSRREIVVDSQEQVMERLRSQFTSSVVVRGKGEDM